MIEIIKSTAFSRDSEKPGDACQRVLIAEDDAMFRKILRNCLESWGYQVTIAEDGAKAWEILQEEPAPQLLILDWMMPKLNGVEVCRLIRERERSPYQYILLVTAKDDKQDLVRGLEAGADDYLTKPFDRNELRARLRTGRRILMLEDKLIDAREAMRFRATHDTLTSLSDRGSIFAQLQFEMRSSQEKRSPVSLLMCDIDHFKQVNDVHGHLVGDEVLQEVSDRLTKSIRSDDSVGRYGGEEFLIVLRGCDRESLPLRAEQVRNFIGSTPFSTRNGPLPVYISVGATTIDYWNADMPVETFLIDADEALYRAKAAGRNRVNYSDPGPKLGESRAPTALPLEVAPVIAA